MIKEWFLLPDVVPPGELVEFAGSDLIARALVRRGIKTRDEACRFLDPNAYPLQPPSALPGIAAGAERIERAIDLGEQICVWGDFDVDGQTATTVLVAALRELGALVTYHIPVRAIESHGIRLPVLQKVIDRGASLIITCDTGIGAHDAVGYAKSRGVEFVITDHHELPKSLPNAVSVSNPRILPEGHPLHTLPGVGAAYLLASELYQRRRISEAAEKHLDLVALGIIADVAVLTGDTRCLLQLGLECLRASRRAGLAAMYELIDLDPSRLTEEHIGFFIAPRLNALGRLDDAVSAVEFFTTEDMERARVLALQLEALNARRKLLCEQVYQGAIAALERTPALLNDPAIVIEHPAWHPGVVGIAANRLAERYHKPAVLLAAPPGEPARGSARSVEGINISAAIALHADLLEAFGGHPMAAGLSIQPDRIAEFRRRLCRTIAESTTRAEPPRLEIDAVVPLADLDTAFVRGIERLAPFGAGNPPLTFAARGLTLKESTPVGRNGEHLQLILADEQGSEFRVIWWQGGEGENAGQLEVMRERFDLAYRARSSNYRGKEQVQVEFCAARPAEGESIRIKRRGIEIIDLRREAYSLASLKTIPALVEEKGGQLQVWAEGEAAEKLHQAGISTRNRFTLARNRTLAIWTTPPGPKELAEAVGIAAPETIYLFAVQEGAPEAKDYLQALAVMVKTKAARTGSVRVEDLAAQTAQTLTLAHSGLRWLEAQGYLRLAEKRPGEFEINPGAKRDPERSRMLLEEIKVLLEESRAYRAYFRRAEKDKLFVGMGE